MNRNREGGRNNGRRIMSLKEGERKEGRKKRNMWSGIEINK